MQSILAGMPVPSDLRRTECDGVTVITVGAAVLACYDSADTGLRNASIVTLTGLGFTGRNVARVLGLTPEHLSQVRSRVRRLGSAGLVRPMGRPVKLSAAKRARARALRSQGVSDVRIGRELGVSDKTVALALKGTTAADTPEQTELDLCPASFGPEGEPELPTGAEGQGGSGSEPVVGPAPGRVSGAGSGGLARIGLGCYRSQYAGAMLLHAFTDRVDAASVFASAGTHTPGRRFDDVAVLTATSTVFALGFASIEQAKYPDRTQIGPVAGIEVLPELRTLRPRLAAIADDGDPLALHRAFATAMLTADPCESGVYFVDEHFMPYTGKLPVGKGWNTKRGRAEAGRVDTMVCDSGGRAVCFTSGEPSGLSVSLPGALAELRAITGPHAPIMIGFDRGGAYASVFRACRDADAHWITYRRGEPAPTRGLPLSVTLTRGRDNVEVCYADETVTINDYGPCRQITLFEHATVVLQILTSDTTACPGALIWFMRARWRIENLFKYLDFYGIDYLADYTATITTNTRPIDNPARVTARTHLKTLQKQREQLRADIGTAHTDRTLSIAAVNRASVAAQRKLHTLDKEITAAQDTLKTIPAKLPANVIDPDAKRAVHRASRRCLQMVLRLLAYNAEHWLAHQLNIYLQNPHEYRATTRNLLHHAGTITYTQNTIHVELDPPNTPRLTRTVNFLLDQINTTPPQIPGDPRPITYTIKTA